MPTKEMTDYLNSEIERLSQLAYTCERIARSADNAADNGAGEHYRYEASENRIQAQRLRDRVQELRDMLHDDANEGVQ